MQTGVEALDAADLVEIAEDPTGVPPEEDYDHEEDDGAAIRDDEDGDL